MIPKFIKYLLPHGLVDVSRNKRILERLGRPVGAGELWHSDQLIYAAEHSGLVLFPSGQAAGLKYVVDIGANEGQWSTSFLKCLKPVKLIAVEPVPATFARLQAAIKGQSNVELKNVAIGDHVGTVKFKVTRDSLGASALKPRNDMRSLVGNNWDVLQEVEIPLETLDHLLIDFAEISLLKIDVQGYEKQVLVGAMQTLKKTKFVLIELNYMPQYEGGSWFGEIHEILTQEHGFFLSNMSMPLKLGTHAVMSDGLYVNSALVPEPVDG